MRVPIFRGARARLYSVFKRQPPASCIFFAHTVDFLARLGGQDPNTSRGGIFDAVQVPERPKIIYDPAEVISIAMRVNYAPRWPWEMCCTAEFGSMSAPFRNSHWETDKLRFASAFQRLFSFQFPLIRFPVRIHAGIERACLLHRSSAIVAPRFIIGNAGPPDVHLRPRKATCRLP